MEREQIIKALECCKDESINECVNCPYNVFTNCDGRLRNDAFSLIKELVEVVEQGGTARGCKESIDNGFSPSVTESQRDNERLRANTIREMHAEIINRCTKGGIYPAFVASTINKIAKEMLEDGHR